MASGIAESLAGFTPSEEMRERIHAKFYSEELDWQKVASEAGGPYMIDKVIGDAPWFFVVDKNGVNAMQRGTARFTSEANARRIAVDWNGGPC